MLEIKTGVVIGLEIDGLEYPLEHGGFQSCSLSSNKRLAVTTCEIVVSDISKQFDNRITLADGSKITVKLGQTLQQFETYYFRVFKFDRRNHGGVSQYTILGYWDSPNWFFQAVKDPIQATSSTAIEQLAESCGLESEVDTTNDEMIWLPNNARTCVFAKNICERGYLDDQSYMVLGMTMFGTIRYKNLNLTSVNQERIPRFLHADTGRPNTFIVHDHKVLTSSGFGNAMGGYRHNVRKQSVKEAPSNVNALNVKRVSEKLLLNKDIRGSLEHGRIEITPVNAGNVHDNWEQAKYQNLRSAMVYGLGVELLIRQPTTDFELFDEFYYQAYELPGPNVSEQVGSYIGLYVVTAKTIHVDCGNYYEKIQGFTNGLNDDPGGFDNQE